MKNLVKSTLLAVSLCFLLSITGFAQDSAVTEVPDLNMVINGKAVALQNVPISLHSRTLIPLREILVDLGVPNDDDHILWNDAEQSVTVNHNNRKVKLTLDQYDMVIDGQSEKMDVCPVLYKDRTYIPARFIAQSFGMKVAWEEYSQTVAICSEDNFNAVKEILTQSDATLSAAKRFKFDQSLQYGNTLTIFQTDVRTDVDEKAFSAVDSEGKRSYTTVTLTSQSGGKKQQAEMERWFDNDHFYQRVKPDTEWATSVYSGEALANEKKKIFDVLYFAKPTDFNCTALYLQSTLDQEKVLYGEFFPAELAKLLLESGSEGAVPTTGSIELRYSNQDKVITNATVKGDAESAEEYTKEKHEYTCTWYIHDINGNFTVSAPEQFELSDLDKAFELLSDGKYKEAIPIFEAAIQADPSDAEAYYGLAIAQYATGEYEKSNENLDHCIALEPSYEGFYVYKAQNYIGLEQYEKAIENCDMALAKNPASSFAYSVKAEALAGMHKYDEAIVCVDKAISLDSEYGEAYVNKISILYVKGDYQACIDLAIEVAKKFKDDYRIPQLKSYAYAMLEDYENAALAMDEVIALVPDNPYAYIDGGTFYLYSDNPKKAQAYAEKALVLDPGNKNATQLLEDAKQAQLPEAEQIVAFVKNNYLYIDKVKDFDQKAAAFIAKGDVSPEAVAAFINSIRVEGDVFTGVLAGEAYDNHVEADQNNHIITAKNDNNVYYVGITEFTSSVGTEFVDYVEGLTDTENATLVIDLRDNGGGLISSANQILDCLLAKCTTVKLSTRDGVVDSYSSDANKVTFKKIYILVNEHSASSSEILTLGLKRLLPDKVTIIGRPTYGKGVGQSVYQGKSGKYQIFLVHFYWSVEDENIMGKHIVPDILVEGNKLEDYLKYVK